MRPDATAIGAASTKAVRSQSSTRAPQAAILVVDDERRCVEASLGACRILGASRAEVEGALLEDLLAPAMRDRIDHVWRAFAGAGGEAGPFEVASATAPAGSVRLTLTANVLPGRHVVTLEPQTPARTESYGNGNGNGSAGSRRSEVRTPSPREIEVLGLLAGGATDGQIAGQLSLSPATVQTHVRNAKAKLGARTRAQAVAMALVQGLIAA